MNFTKTARLFAAVDFTAVEKQALHCISYDLRAQCKSGRMVTEDMYHITLHFFEQVPLDRVKDIKGAMQRAAADAIPFSLVTGSLGSFGPRDSAVLWIGLHEGIEPLRALHQKLEVELSSQGFLTENRLFKGHITLGREVDQRRFETPLNEMELPSVNLAVNAITLMESTKENGRPVYVPLFSVPLI